MTQRLKRPAEFLLDERATLTALFKDKQTLKIERRRRAYERLRVRAAEMANADLKRPADSLEVYEKVFTDLAEAAASGHARKLGVFETDLPLESMSRIADYVDLYVDDDTH